MPLQADAAPLQADSAPLQADANPPQADAAPPQAEAAPLQVFAASPQDIASLHQVETTPPQVEVVPDVRPPNVDVPPPPAIFTHTNGVVTLHLVINVLHIGDVPLPTVDSDEPDINAMRNDDNSNNISLISIAEPVKHNVRKHVRAILPPSCNKLSRVEKWMYEQPKKLI